MKFELGTVTVCLLSSISVVFASVIEKPNTTWLQARALSINNAPTETIWCYDVQGNWVAISPELVTGSIQQATDLENAGQKIGIYPSRIVNFQSLPNPPAGVSTCMHYPIAEQFAGPTVYNRLAQFAENIRVMYTYDVGGSTATFLGVWTHAEASWGQYLECRTTAGWSSKQ